MAINDAVNLQTANFAATGSWTFSNATHILSALATGTTSSIVYIDPTTGLLTKGAVPGGSGGFSTINVQTFTTNGTYTPTASMKYCIIEAVAGGGGAGGCAQTTGGGTNSGGGGGSGGYARLLASAATIGASQAVVVGAAGAGGLAATGANGTSGGNTTFGSLITCGGGVFGTGGGVQGGVNTDTNTPGGAGGTATGGTVNIAGQHGGCGLANGSTTGLSSFAVSGIGGSTPLGMGGSICPPNSGAGFSGTGFGSGGGGGATWQGTSSMVGGAGGAGIVIITEFI